MYPYSLNEVMPLGRKTIPSIVIDYLTETLEPGVENLPFKLLLNSSKRFQDQYKLLPLPLVAFQNLK